MRWTCPDCDSVNHASFTRCACGYEDVTAKAVQPVQEEVAQVFGEAPADAVTKSEPGTWNEVISATGETMRFNTASDLREAILGGPVSKELKARKVTIDGKGKSNETAWVPVEKFVEGNAELRALYRPVWHYTMKYAWYGVIAGFALKAIDTSVTIFSANETAGLAWLLVLGSLLLSKKWPLAPGFALFMTFKLGVQANFFITALATMLVGALFGAPGGMIVGTVVGHFRKNSMNTAPDAEPEGNRPYWQGIALPLLALAVLIPLYIWFNVKLVEWVGSI